MELLLGDGCAEEVLGASGEPQLPFTSVVTPWRVWPAGDRLQTAVRQSGSARR